MMADGSYDTQEVYNMLSTHKSDPIQGIMPPRKDAVLSDNAFTSPTPEIKTFYLSRIMEGSNGRKKQDIIDEVL
jgi:hypothetical protein